MKIILILILTINTAFAQNSITLNKGEIAPFSGHLVKSEKLKELIKSDKQVPLLKAKFELQEDLIQYHKDNTREIRSELSKSELKGNLKMIGSFFVGVLVTGFAFKVNQEITR